MVELITQSIIVGAITAVLVLAGLSVFNHKTKWNYFGAWDENGKKKKLTCFIARISRLNGKTLNYVLRGNIGAATAKKGTYKFDHKTSDIEVDVRNPGYRPWWLEGVNSVIIKKKLTFDLIPAAGKPAVKICELTYKNVCLEFESYIDKTKQIRIQMKWIFEDGTVIIYR